MVAVFMLVMMTVPMFAADPPSTIVIDWNGGGAISGAVVAGDDMYYNWSVNANSSVGNFNMTDYNNNPYTYNVDSVNAGFTASVSGGSATYSTEHTDQYAPMYGDEGQKTYSFICATSDGSASMAMWTNSNYASLQEANYGHAWTSSGDTFTADASSFQIVHQVTDSSGDYAFINAVGSGSASVDCMSSDIGSSSTTFGKGAGCYTDASYDGVGNQIVQFVASGNNSVNQFGITVNGNGDVGSACLNTILTFNGNASVPNFSASVD